MDDVAEIINALISIHGEEGVCPSREDWRRIFERPGPVPLLNLLKFREQIETPGGTVTGVRAYAQYSAGVADAFRRAGGERLFYAPVASVFGLGDTATWDAAILTRYPSARALAGMWLDREFVAAHAHRIDGVERSQVLVFDHEREAYGVPRT